MSRWARRAKRDGNHGDIAKALRAVGASVEELHAVGGGVPDLLVGYRGRAHLLEVKNPATRYGRGKKGGKRTAATNEAQKDWREAWRGPAVVVVRTIDEALAAIGAHPDRRQRARCGVTHFIRFDASDPICGIKTRAIVITDCVSWVTCKRCKRAIAAAEARDARR